ncbi:MAG: hypothetical protein ACKO6N_11285 [Myxococcota bacterium]
MKSILETLALRRMLELAVESMVPLVLALLGYTLVVIKLGQPTPGRPLTDLEVFLVLVVPTVLISLGVTRIGYLAGFTRPWSNILLTLGVTSFFMAVMPPMTAFLYEDQCRSNKGRLVGVQLFTEAPVPDVRGNATELFTKVCQLEPETPTPWRSGPLHRPVWRGMPQLLPWNAAFLAIISLLVAL